MVKIIGEYGFCFGVKNAIQILKENKKKDGKIILLHPLIHNQTLNDKLMEENNAVLYDKNTNILENDTIIFSAHGHLKEEEEKFKNYHYENAICPLITKRYKFIKENYNNDINYLFLGKKKHQETISFLSFFKFLKLVDVENIMDDLEKLNLKKEDKTFLIPQTTVSYFKYNQVLSYLKEKTNLVSNLPICPHYLKRATDALQILKNEDINKTVFVVCGDKMSSNANEIYNLIKSSCSNLMGYIALTASQLNLSDLKNKKIYLISSTSVSKEEVESLYDELSKL